MSNSKTKTTLLDVARQLFAKSGVANTTMNDIAIASKKGRRTLYTYFKSKEELYTSLIESELEHLTLKMVEVSKLNISPEEKLIELIYTRLKTIKEVVLRNGSLRADFFRDIWKVERIRKKFDRKERSIIQAILQEGQDLGVFSIEDVGIASDLVHYAVKGIEVPYIRGQIGTNLDPETKKKQITDIVLAGLNAKQV